MGLAQRAAGNQSAACINLLCDFITNPFGNIEQARELLSQIEGCSIDHTKLDRGTFCFQIAFYFLACLAIADHIDDPILQKSWIHRLYDRVRGFHAGTDLTARFSDFIVTASERTQFATGLRELLVKTGKQHDDISQVVISKLGIFDLVGVRRLHEYHVVLGLPDSPLRFYLVAEQVLLHFNGKECHTAVVAVIADLLSANYDILSKIILSDLGSADIRDGDAEGCFVPLPLDQRMPDIAGRRPSKVYLAGTYLLLLIENVGPIGSQGAIRFRYVLAAYDRRRELPVCFVTLEDSASISNVLCVFEADGSHSNYGSLRSRDVFGEFLDNGMRMMRERFNLGEIEELSCRRQPQDRTNRSWNSDAGAAMHRAPSTISQHHESVGAGERAPVHEHTA
jgi:hypothetical protein